MAGGRFPTFTGSPPASHAARALTLLAGWRPQQQQLATRTVRVSQSVSSVSQCTRLRLYCRRLLHFSEWQSRRPSQQATQPSPWWVASTASLPRPDAASPLQQVAPVTTQWHRRSASPRFCHSTSPPFHTEGSQGRRRPASSPPGSRDHGTQSRRSSQPVGYPVQATTEWRTLTSAARFCVDRSLPASTEGG